MKYFARDAGLAHTVVWTTGTDLSLL